MDDVDTQTPAFVLAPSSGLPLVSLALSLALSLSSLARRHTQLKFASSANEYHSSLLKSYPFQTLKIIQIVGYL